MKNDPGYTKRYQIKAFSNVGLQHKYCKFLCWWWDCSNSCPFIDEQARSLPTDKLRVVYISVNSAIYLIQVTLSKFTYTASPATNIQPSISFLSCNSYKIGLTHRVWHYFLSFLGFSHKKLTIIYVGDRFVSGYSYG